MNRHRRVLRRAGRKIRAFRTGYPNFYWPTEYKVVTQSFGRNPEYYGQFGLPGHEGIDMRAPLGSDIYAVWQGKVVMVKDFMPDSHAYGFHIRIDHRIKRKFDGFVRPIFVTYQSIYAHFKNPPLVKVGERVRKGQLIGLANDTGNSFGSHLHFSLKQRNGPVPDTEIQNEYKAKWAKRDHIDPTLFFRELREGYD
jgi:murein DD-endopeptidase MepM/ murein hydrolase activator NlpD